MLKVCDWTVTLVIASEVDVVVDEGVDFEESAVTLAVLKQEAVWGWDKKNHLSVLTHVLIQGHKLVMYFIECERWIDIHVSNSL